MNATNQAQLLVALQDLEEMIREAEDPQQRARLESLGFPVTGIDELRSALEALQGKISPAMITRYRRGERRLHRLLQQYAQLLHQLGEPGQGDQLRELRPDALLALRQPVA